MSADRRWTGGIANREWTRGGQAAPIPDTERLKTGVLAYLADCRAAPWLDPAYHPTEAGALKAVFHRARAEADIVRDLYRNVAPTGR